MNNEFAGKSGVSETEEHINALKKWRTFYNFH